MPQDTAPYFVLPAGAVQEEPRTWEEIEAMAGAGLLAPDTLIFFPEENDWRRAADTQLAPFFTAEVAAPEAAAAGNEELEEQYREACNDLHDWNSRVLAAELAIKLGDREAAVEHFSEALEANPFHPRIVQEAKRLLAPPERNRLRFLERNTAAWEDPIRVATYPLQAGPIQLLAPAAVLFGLSWVPGGVVIASLLLFVWAVDLTRNAAVRGGRVSWSNFILDPPATVIRPLVVAGVVGAEIYGIFVLIAAGLAARADVGVVTLIGKSPFLLMPMLILTLVYLPAVIALAANPNVAVKYIADPRNIGSAIGKMEWEYLATAGMLLVPFILWAVVDSIFARLPIVGSAVSAVVGTYVFLCGGFVLSCLHARFRDHFGSGRPR